MRARLIWVGRAKGQRAELELAGRYLKRINAGLRLEEVVVKPLAQEPQHLERESLKVLDYVGADDWVVLLDERGKQMTSKQWANWLDQRILKKRNVTWIIGGAFGVGDAVKDRANDVISLARMTLPHALARVLLLEQIYRAWCIRANHPYHHE